MSREAGEFKVAIWGQFAHTVKNTTSVFHSSLKSIISRTDWRWNLIYAMGSLFGMTISLINSATKQFYGIQGKPISTPVWVGWKSGPSGSRFIVQVSALLFLLPGLVVSTWPLLICQWGHFPENLSGFFSTLNFKRALTKFRGQLQFHGWSTLKPVGNRKVPIFLFCKGIFESSIEVPVLTPKYIPNRNLFTSSPVLKPLLRRLIFRELKIFSKI